MKCPNCNSSKTHVTDSRMVGYARRRRYECLSCGRRFSTRELVVKETTQKRQDLRKECRHEE